MPAKDTHHNAVKNALIKEGWTITADPYPIRYEEVKLFADLAGEKTIAATKKNQNIVIEIKSFLGRSSMREFETALGQYLIYTAILSLENPEYQVYLAIGEKVYHEFFQQVGIKFILKKYQVYLLVVDLEKETIIQWKS